MRKIILPLCPPNNKPNRRQEVPTKEDWQEYGKDLTSALLACSSWAIRQIEVLTIKISSITSSTVNTAAAATVGILTRYQPTLHIPNNAAAATYTTSTAALTGLLKKAEACLYPIETQTWWNSARTELEGYIPLPQQAPTVEHEDDDNNNEEQQQHYTPPQAVTLVTAPIENRPSSHRSQFNAFEAAYTLGGINHPQVHSLSSAESSEEEEEEESMLRNDQENYTLFVHPLDISFGTEGTLNMLMLNYIISTMNLYYMDHVLVGNKHWQDVFTHSKNSRISFQQQMFLAIMECRVVRQLFCEVYNPNSARDEDMILPSPAGLAYKQLFASPTIFPWLFQNNLALSRPFPISIYSQAEIDHVYTAMLFKVCRIEWHPELHHYTHALADRLACFFYFALPEKVMNVDGLRQSLTSAYVTKMTKKQELAHGTGSASPTLFTYNLDFLVRNCWRYFYTIQNNIGFEQFFRSVDSAQLLMAVSLPKQGLNLPRELSIQSAPLKYSRRVILTLAAKLEERIATLFNRLETTRAFGELDSINEHIRKDVVNMILPQGDLEWSSYKYIINTNSHNILDKIHGSLYKVMRLELFPTEGRSVLKVYFNDAKSPAHPLHFIHNHLILYLFDKYMSVGLSSLRFKATYLIPQRDIHFFGHILHNSVEPYIRQWMGRYYVTFNNSISTKNATIYEVLAEWVLIAFLYCPALWENIQEFGLAVIPDIMLQQNNSQYSMNMSWGLQPKAPKDDVDAMDIDEPEGVNPLNPIPKENESDDDDDNLLIL